MHLVWPPKAIMIVLNWATHLASRAICLAIVIGVAACGPAPRKLDDPIFEFSRVCEISQSKLSLVDTVGITSLYSLGESGLDYFVVQGGGRCGFKFKDYSPKPNFGPQIFSNSSATFVRFPKFEIDGRHVPPFGSLEFMQSYSDNYITQCMAQPKPRSYCVDSLRQVASDAVNLNFLTANFSTAARSFVTIINGSIYYKEKPLL